MINITEALELCNKATAGEWKAEKSEKDCNVFGDCLRGLKYCDEACNKCDYYEIQKGALVDGPKFIECGDYSYFTDNDAAFIAAARTLLPQALDELWQTRTALKNALDVLRGLEWLYVDELDDVYCPECESNPIGGHAPDCRLAASLQEINGLIWEE